MLPLLDQREPSDPPSIRWDEQDLPDAWPDQMSVGRPRIIWRLIKALLGRGRPMVELPDDMPGAELIPKYVLQEFHGLPNGNYSKRVTAGYSRWFDRVMLGVMARRRARIADAMSDCESVLDIGCGAGAVAGKVSERIEARGGTPDVWGLDPSPYMLQHAQRAFPTIRLVQGLAERTDFPSARFDGITACFLFHELPPGAARLALDECHRLLRPGGKLFIVEPGPEQLTLGRIALFKKYGWRGLYFRALARRVHEPFVPSFHRRDHREWLADHGFNIALHRADFPTNEWLAIRADLKERGEPR